MKITREVAFSNVFYSHIFIRRNSQYQLIRGALQCDELLEKERLKNARIRGIRARKKLNTGFYRETIPQHRTS